MATSCEAFSSLQDHQRFQAAATSGARRQGDVAATRIFHVRLSADVLLGVFPHPRLRTKSGIFQNHDAFSLSAEVELFQTMMIILKIRIIVFPIPALVFFNKLFAFGLSVLVVLVVLVVL